MLQPDRTGFEVFARQLLGCGYKCGEGAFDRMTRFIQQVVFQISEDFKIASDKTIVFLIGAAKRRPSGKRDKRLGCSEITAGKA